MVGAVSGTIHCIRAPGTLQASTAASRVARSLKDRMDLLAIVPGAFSMRPGNTTAAMLYKEGGPAPRLQRRHGQARRTANGKAQDHSAAQLLRGQRG